MGPLLALALLAAAQQDEGPVQTAPAPEAITPQQAATPLPGEAEFTPPGAPQDDYGFVAWCHGVLSGHRELASLIRPQLDSDADAKALEDDLQTIGNEYLQSYQEALIYAEGTKPRASTERAMAAREAGYAKWRDALAAASNGGATPDGRKIDLAGTYVAWSLPGRCEHATKRLMEGDDLLSAAYRLDRSKPLGKPGEAAATEPAKAEPAKVEAARKNGWFSKLVSRF